MKENNMDHEEDVNKAGDTKGSANEAAAPPTETPMRVVPPVAPATELSAGEPTLMSATVRFQALDDGKERNSVVTVTVRDGTNQIIAFIDNIFDEFKPHRLYGPYDMQVVNSVAKSLVRPGGSVTVYFLQTANDEWHTNMLVDLAFSDATHLAIEEQDLSFTGDHPKQVFGL